MPPELLNQMLAAIAALCAGVGAYLSARAHRHAKQANDAVNHTHVSGTPRLYDLALENRERMYELLEWKRGFVGTPFESGPAAQAWYLEWRHVQAIVLRLERERAGDDTPGPETPS